MTKKVNISQLSEHERERFYIKTGMHAAEIGLSCFLADIASIAMAVQLIGGKWLDRKTVAAVVKAANQLQELANRPDSMNNKGEPNGL